MNLKIGDLLLHRALYYAGIFEGIKNDEYAIRCIACGDEPIHYQISYSNMEELIRGWEKACP